MYMTDLCALHGAPTERISSFSVMATTVAGLETIAAAQIASALPEATVTHTVRGKVFFSAKTSLARLLSLRCAENLHAVLAALPCGKTKADLQTFGTAIKKLPFASFLPAFCDPTQVQRLHVSASRAGKHTYSRFDLAEQALTSLCQTKFFQAGDAERHDLHFRIDLTDCEALVSLKLTAPAFRYRSTQKSFMPGATAPSVANAMIFLSAPTAKDVFLDPFCGSGTVVVERECYPHRKIFASDLSIEAVQATKENVLAQTIVRQGDARTLSFGDACIDAIVTNLPWDVQIKSEDLLALYCDFLAQAKRVLRPTGRLLVLTDKRETLLQACQQNGFFAQSLAQLSFHGLHPEIFQLT